MVDTLSKPNRIKTRPRVMIDLRYRYTSTVITAIMISLTCSLHHVSQQDEQQLEDVDQLFALTLALLCVLRDYTCCLCDHMLAALRKKGSWK